MRFKRTGLITCLGALFISGGVQAQTSPNLTQEQKTFLAEYQSAYEKGDFDAYWALVHPQSKACITDAFRGYYAHEFAKKAAEMRQFNVDNIRFAALDEHAYEASLQDQYRGHVYAPLMPQYNFSLRAVQNKAARNVCSDAPETYRLSIAASYDKTQWYEVLPCARSGYDEVIRRNVEGEKRQHERIEELYQSVPVDLWAQLQTILVDQHNRNAAALELQKRVGVSTLKAREVIKMGCDSLTQKQVQN